MCYIFGFSVKQYSTGKGFSVFTIQNDYLPPTPVSRTQKYGKCVSQSATPHTELNVSLETVNLTHWGTSRLCGMSSQAPCDSSDVHPDTEVFTEGQTSGIFQSSPDRDIPETDNRMSLYICHCHQS